jgi:hypothetical protein
MNPNTQTVVMLQITTPAKGGPRYFANGLRISADQYGSLWDTPAEKFDTWCRGEDAKGTHRAGASVCHEYEHVINVIGRNWLRARARSEDK